MKKINFVGILITFLIFAGIVGGIYHVGRQRKPLVFSQIPSSTLDWANLLNKFNTVNISIVDKGPFHWENDLDLGQEDEQWMNVNTDPNFIIYYKNDDLLLNVQNARRVLQIANEAIPEIEELMGGYPFPEFSNGRKLAIYLPASAAEYSSVINSLHGTAGDRSGTVGMFICHVGPLGCLTDGIVLHPSCFNYEQDQKMWVETVLRHEMNHFAFFSSLDYSQEIRHPLWVSEGLAEYASKKGIQITSRDSIDYIAENCDLLKEFPRERQAEYWAGRSFYTFIEETKGTFETKKFIRSLLDHELSDVLILFFTDSVNVKELWIHDMLAKTYPSDTVALDEMLKLNL